MAATLILAALAFAKPQEPQAAFSNYSLPVGYTVSLPAKPELMKAEKGDDRKAFISYGDDAIYFVSDSPLSKDEQTKLSPDQQIAAYICGALSDKKDRHLVKYSDALLDGWPGVEYSVEDKELGDIISSRCFAMNGHLVEFGAIYASGGVSPVGLPAFFASFKQTDSPKYGPESSTQVGFTHLEPDDVPFRLDFPGDAADKPETLGEGAGKVVLHSFDFAKDMRRFDFTYLDLPEGAADAMPEDGPEQLREQTLESILAYFGGKKDSSTIEVRDGNDWLTARFNVDGVGFGRADVMYFKGRVYALVAVGPECWSDSPEYKRFFDSFEVKNG